MKMNTLKVLVIIVCMMQSLVISAQKDSTIFDSNYKKHLTFTDTFFGNEELHQVCYPKDHKSFFYVIIAFGILSTLLAIIIFYIKTAHNNKLNAINGIIETQNKDLIDSINYAKRIQDAILPEQAVINKVLQNGFVLYQPKNIVSGDFYWLHHHNGLSIIVLFDCTGHGVPGAMLTMLSNDAINKAILEKKLTDPSAIMHSMNDDIKQSLKQKTVSDNQDSMEVAIVIVNEKTKELNYAGANISLTLVKNNVLEIIGAAKCSVGSVQDNVNEPPIAHCIQLNSNDSFYLYSDGYADQFGGEKGKKFKYKQLENLLLEVSIMPAHQQIEKLQTTINNWRGNLEQVDDITVIGYKMS